MAKRQSSQGNARSARPSSPTRSEAVDDRLVAFADMLGTMAGTIHARAEGLIDAGKLSRQLTSVRDGAAQLLEQLRKAAPGRRGRQTPASGSRARKPRGDMVDAPGKKHRKPMPADPNATGMEKRAATARAERRAMRTTIRPRRG